jgi:virginiamycin B lyase
MSSLSSRFPSVQWRHALIGLSCVASLALMMSMAGCSLEGDSSPKPTLTATSASTLSKVAEFPVLSPGAFSLAMTAGADGNVWFSEMSVGGSTTSVPTKIGRITSAGTVTEFPLSVQNAVVESIVKGSDGNVWYLRTGSPTSTPGAVTPYAIGRISPTGVMTEFSITEVGEVLTVGPDGALWFTELASGGAHQLAGKIGRITVSGEISEFPLPTAGVLPGLITTGADGALWFTTAAMNQTAPVIGIGRITTAGVVTMFPLPPMAGRASSLVSGPDGNLWLTEPPANKGLAPHLARVTPAGAYTEFPLKGAGQGAVGLAAGPDGALWAGGVGLIERFTVAGVESSIALPDPNYQVIALTAGPNGTLWFSEVSSNSGAPGTTGKIGRIE